MSHTSSDPAAEAPSEAVLPGMRQDRLAALVRERGQVTVTELMALFGVSRDTIRRDLALLEQRGQLVRTHGGAFRSDSLVMYEVTMTQRMDAEVDAKRRIGRLAATLVRDGETLIINGGSSTYYFAGELGERRHLMIVTNNLRVPPALPERSMRAVYVLGGAYWSSPQVTIGPIGFSSTSRISADTAVVGVTGVSADGLSISRLEEASVTSEMLAVARRSIVLVDHTKFRVSAFAHVASFASVQYLITDAPPPADIAAALDQAGVQVLVAPPRA